MDDIAQALDALIAALERRAADLDAEVRGYPGPIARCDEQLPGLIEQRARVRAALASVRALHEELVAGIAPR